MLRILRLAWRTEAVGRRASAGRLAIIALPALLGLAGLFGSTARLGIGTIADRQVASMPASASAGQVKGLFDAAPSLPVVELSLGANAPLPAALRPAAQRLAAVTPNKSPPRPSLALRPAIRAQADQAGLVPPTPIARAPQLGARRATPRRTAAGTQSARARTASARLPDADRGSIVERLFGPQAASAPPLAYAALPADPTRTAPEAPQTAPAAPAGAGVAVYDISARTVTLPSGERLEAHSGLGSIIDDARYVHLRMRGATPPGTYELSERGAPFHGVRALRLNPVGGSAAVHGRAGLLAHTFMLGPNGDSNGCVSFRNYDRFLQAYLRGEIRQLVVVGGTPGLPGLFGRLFGMGTQPSYRASRN